MTADSLKEPSSRDPRLAKRKGDITGASRVHKSQRATANFDHFSPERSVSGGSSMETSSISVIESVVTGRDGSLPPPDW